jgi:hypothetical protein
LVEGFRDQAVGLWNAITSPVQTATSIYNAVTHPIETAKTVYNNVKQTGIAIANGDNKEAGKAVSNILTGMAGANATKALSSAKVVSRVEAVSPNVKSVLDKIKQIKDEGGSVKVNPLDPSNKQELNMTFKAKDGSKLDMRVETHELSKTVGGDGVTPQRHLNVDVTNPNGNRVKMNDLNKGHKILE